ncbi:MAG TPA: hypothetical protein VK823_22660 [Streptosporangiaceae bacterium]|jgi:hypothetical protein|nr:hypothetical protein [Streptosporangiaceae bacterium]
MRLSQAGRRFLLSALAATSASAAVALAGCSSSPPSAQSAPAAVRGFDAAGVSTGTGDQFTQAQWRTIRLNGFKLFLTDPVVYSSECSNGSCNGPVNTCTVNPAAVAQIEDAYHEGIDYAVYTRNVNCLASAIRGLPHTLQAHLSFAVLDIESGPGVPLTMSLVNGVTALGETPVVYSLHQDWPTVMGSSTAFSTLPLQDGQVPDFAAPFPAPYPTRFPVLVAMPHPYGGWSGFDAKIQQQQCCTDLRGPAGTVGGSADQVDLDSVNASWLAGLPHHA